MAQKTKIKNFLASVYYSFPVQLLINHLKRNHLLLFCWFILFLVVTENIGRYLGIPFLYLDPEYLDNVSFTSFFIMGFVIAGFSVAFHITAYIIDGHRFTFLGAMPKPFSRFSLNNSAIPLIFLVVYIIQIIKFQKYNEFATSVQIIKYLAGLLSGYVTMTLAMFIYFRLTNKDIFKFVADSFNEKLKQKLRITRATIMEKMHVAKKREIRVDNYINLNLKIEPVPSDTIYRTDFITKVFDQNHLNLVIFELLVFLLLLLLGVFRDMEFFQLPAAATTILFFTIIMMFIGAFAYWFRNWAVTTALIIAISVNFLMKQELFSGRFKAFGLDYNVAPAVYSHRTIREQNREELRNNDLKNTLLILENWKSKFKDDKKPRAVFLCTSGGGQRASLWTLTALQKADSATDDKLFKHSILITGASGGIVGASYYRELKLRALAGEEIDPGDPVYLDNISKDNLNPVIFSFLVNDLFVKFQRFEYNGYKYSKDRGYSFEEQMNKNTGSILDKPLSDYRNPEKNAVIPLLIMGPTIINDGRKLFVSPHNVSYMNIIGNETISITPEGIDFLRFYEKQGSDQLRYLSALRMNATFPYITPNITLPSKPPMEIMDAGISDNFGISDALRFIYAFKDWLEQNTSGIIILSIRDSEKNKPIAIRGAKSLIEKFSNPISSIYINFENLQEINNNDKIIFAENWYNGEIMRIDLQYIPHSLTGDPKDIERASLSWRLTTREKKDIRSSIYLMANQKELKRLDDALQ